MPVTLSALLIVLVIAPGFVSIAVYNARLLRATQESVGVASSWQSALIPAAIVSLFVHLILLATLEFTRFPNADFEIFLTLLSGFDTSETKYSAALTNVSDYFTYVVSYFVVSIVGPSAVSWGLRGIVTSKDWDLRYKFLRSNDPWHYLFMGADEPELPSLTLVSATVELGSEAYLYLGILVDYRYSSNGTLTWVRLIGAKRRLLSEDKDGDEAESEASGLPDALSSDRFYGLDGEYLVLFCKDVKTLNIDYIYMVDAEDVDAEAASNVEPT